MSDTQAGQPGAQPQAPIIVNGQYIKDLSFESPGAPDIFGQMQGAKPELSINVNVKTRPVHDANKNVLYEVVLDLQAEMKVGDKTGFIAELQYAGVFTLNVAEEHVQPVLMIECPRILFPYARQILSDVTQQGGFMPLYLQPLDFAAMYHGGQQQALANIDADVAQMVKDKTN